MIRADPPLSKAAVRSPPVSGRSGGGGSPSPVLVESVGRPLVAVTAGVTPDPVVGLELPVGAAVPVGVVVGVVVAAMHTGSVMSLVSNVTAPLLASARPSRNAPVFMVTEMDAMIVPTKLVPVSSVAELPIFQKTLHGEAPLMNTTLLAGAVVKVESTWKMNTDCEFP